MSLKVKMQSDEFSFENIFHGCIKFLFSELFIVLALTVKIRKSQDFLAPISGSTGEQIFSLTFRNSTSIFLKSHLWSKTAILKLNNT